MKSSNHHIASTCSLFSYATNPQDCLVLECPIERAAWRNGDAPHFLRKNKWANISGVPALVKVGCTARPIGVLVEDQIMDAVLLQALIEA
jgi:hypothetical protein